MGGAPARPVPVDRAGGCTWIGSHPDRRPVAHPDGGRPAQEPAAVPGPPAGARALPPAHPVFRPAVEHPGLPGRTVLRHQDRGAGLRFHGPAGASGGSHVRARRRRGRRATPGARRPAAAERGQRLFRHLHGRRRRAAFLPLVARMGTGAALREPAHPGLPAGHQRPQRPPHRRPARRGIRAGAVGPRIRPHRWPRPRQGDEIRPDPRGHLHPSARTRPNGRRDRRGAGFAGDPPQPPRL